jgi:membrane protein implicated in regulation of membrane protease activity
VGAAFLAAIPLGVGHYYLGFYNRGILFAGAFLFSCYLAVWPLIVFFYLFAIIDAYRQAQFINYGEHDPVAKQKGPGQGALGLGVFLVVVGGLLMLENWVDFDLYYWLQDYWEAVMIVIGLYLIIGALKERAEEKQSEAGSDQGFSSE